MIWFDHSNKLIRETIYWPSKQVAQTIDKYFLINIPDELVIIPLTNSTFLILMWTSYGAWPVLHKPNGIKAYWLTCFDKNSSNSSNQNKSLFCCFWLVQVFNPLWCGWVLQENIYKIILITIIWLAWNFTLPFIHSFCNNCSIKINFLANYLFPNHTTSKSACKQVLHRVGIKLYHKIISGTSENIKIVFLPRKTPSFITE